jgi:DNA polymerase-3 subunit epsilon
MLTASPKARSIAWAQEIVSDPRTVFIDTETTGLDGSAEIVDIAVVGVDGEVLLDMLVKPVRPIPYGASRIHGIYDRDVAHAAPWSEVYRLALPLLVGRPVVIFNAGYDRKIIHQCCAQLQLPLIHAAPTWQCAMKRHAEYVGEPGRWGKDYRWHKLENAARSFGIAPGGHRALGDAEACRQVVHAMARG